MFSDDYDPNDIPLDQAKGYSYPVPSNPLSLPLPVVEDEYDDYDPNDIPADQAAPTAYLPPTYDEVTLLTWSYNCLQRTKIFFKIPQL